MDRNQTPSAREEKQQGSMMLMTMMIILIFVFTGLYVMEMAILEEITVSNEQRNLQVYQTAYGELEAQLEFLETSPNILNDAIAADQNLTIIINPTGCTTPREVCQTATLRYVGETPPPTGYSIDDYIGLMYEIDSVAVLQNVSARSSQTLGFTYVIRRAGS